VLEKNRKTWIDFLLSNFRIALLIISCAPSLLFAGYETGTASDNHGNRYNFSSYRTNDLIEYDQYIQRQNSANACGQAVGFLIGAGIAKGIQAGVTSHRNSVIGELIKGYNFKCHNKYMSLLAETDRLKEKHKFGLVSLSSSYKKYREDLDKSFLSKIREFGMPKITYWECDLDLAETPYTKNKKIENWVKKYYKNEEKQNFVLEVIYDYKKNRLIADKELDQIYYMIIKS
jgi:hypothetical protein